MTKGVIITVVQPGGVADSSGKIKPGDEILQVDDVLVMDMKQEEVVALLKRPSATIHLVLVRYIEETVTLQLNCMVVALVPGACLLNWSLISKYILCH